MNEHMHLHRPTGEAVRDNPVFAADLPRSYDVVDRFVVIVPPRRAVDVAPRGDPPPIARKVRIFGSCARRLASMMPLGSQRKCSEEGPS